MVFFGKFDKVLLLFVVVVFGTVFAFSFNVDVTQPHHSARQIAIGAESILGDNNALLAKYGGTGVVTCSDGNVLVWSASANSWKCGKNILSITDVNNIVTAASGGTGLVSCLDGNVLKWSGAQNKWVCGDNIASGGAASVVIPSCQDGNVLKWSGGTWVCGSGIYSGTAGGVSAYRCNYSGGGYLTGNSCNGIVLSENPATCVVCWSNRPGGKTKGCGTIECPLVGRLLPP